LNNLLEVKNLTTRFYTQDSTVHAVNNISFTVKEREMLGIVGESGCGKSVTMLSIMRLIPQPPGKIESGEVIFEGRDLLKLNPEQMRLLRGQDIAMIFQDPMTSLNPVLTIGMQITEALRTHMCMNESQAKGRAIELLELVGISRAAEHLQSYPHQFSGGMRQRVMIAMALACEPKLLIADEPTTALDVTIQAQIIDLVKHLQEKFGMAVIWITHDLGVVARLAKRVMVMYAGYIVEDAAVKEIYRTPRHPYTLGLLGSLPRLDDLTEKRLTSIPGQPPDASALLKQCPFAPRCRFVVDHCWQENPLLQSVTSTHQVACWCWEQTQG
jgi:oligopeptide transport system ATP-binding protein